MLVSEKTGNMVPNRGSSGSGAYFSSQFKGLRGAVWLGWGCLLEYPGPLYENKRPPDVRDPGGRDWRYYFLMATGGLKKTCRWGCRD